MKRIFSLLRILPLIIFCVVAVTATFRVQMNEANPPLPQLPTRIGASAPPEPTFFTKVTAEMNDIWVGFYAAMLPGLPSMHADKTPENSLSLDALKARNKRLQTQNISALKTY